MDDNDDWSLIRKVIGVKQTVSDWMSGGWVDEQSGSRSDFIVRKAASQHNDNTRHPDHYQPDKAFINLV